MKPLFLIITSLLSTSLCYGADSILTILEKQSASSQRALLSGSCAEELTRNTSILRNIRAEGGTLSEMKSQGKEIVVSSFKQRVKLLEIFRAGTLSKGRASKECENAFRKYLNARRIFEEYTALNGGLDDSPEIFQGKEPQLLVNPKYSKFELKSGDILVSRGTAVVSATIAKIGDQEGIYSHAAMVYVEPKTQKVYVLQSEIETGVEAEPIEKKYMRDGKVRANVYRPANSALAASAAQWMYDHLMEVKKTGDYVRYNFEMDFLNEKAMFCSQLPYMAYQKASGGKFLLGSTYKTTFVDRQIRPFLNGLLVKVPSTYSPNDVELDEKLELVAEWRDYSRIGKAHRRDAVMESVFNWMEQDGYRFNDLYNSFEGSVLGLLRKLPITGNLLSDSLADNIKHSQLKYFLTMNTLGAAILQDYVKKEESKFHGIVPSYNEMLQLVSEVKAEDLRRQQYAQFMKQNGEQVAPAYDSHFMKYLVK